MKQNLSSGLDLSKLRIGAVLNKSSGSCDEGCQGKLTTILRGANLGPAEIAVVEGKDVVDALKKAIAEKADVIIVLGGDGTIRTAAEQCAGSDTKLIPLPGGTMNMLPKALYGDRPWAEILASILSAPALLDVGGGEVEGHRFFCAGIFGSPALWADAREAARKSYWSSALEGALRAYHEAFSRKIRYRFDDGKEGSTTALTAICPLISSAIASESPEFEAAILDPDNLGDAIHLAWSATFSSWRRDENVTAVKARRVRIYAHGSIPAILDGERVTLSSAAEIQYVKGCFAAVVPTAPREG